MKKNFMLIAVMAIALFFAVPMVSEASDSYGWRGNDVDGWWYGTKDGTSYYSNGFYQIGDEGDYYYFDAAGYMATGWKMIDGEWHYFEASGAAAEGWLELGGAWYYFGYQGYMLSDTTLQIGDETYLFTDTGANLCTPGWVEYAGEWYCIKDNGALYTDWQWLGNNWYYFHWDGVMAKEGVVYFSPDDMRLFDDNGIYLESCGWHWVDDSRFYVSETSQVLTEWQWIDNAWYYFGDDGRMYANRTAYLGSETERFYFKPDGQMLVGWYNMADAYDKYPSWRYSDASGRVYTGWLQEGSDWYYINDGYMQTGMFYDYNKDEYGKPIYDDDECTKYYFGRDGRMVYGWYHDEYYDATGYYSDSWIYTDPTTGVAHDGWLAVGNQWYFIDEDGYMVRDGIALTLDDPEWEDFAGEDHSMSSVEYAAYEAAREAHENSGYIFDASGVLVSGGWYTSTSSNGQTWYYANADGSAYDGWLLDGGSWYYINKGRMSTNCYQDGCWLGADGVWR